MRWSIVLALVVAVAGCSTTEADPQLGVDPAPPEAYVGTRAAADGKLDVIVSTCASHRITHVFVQVVDETSQTYGPPVLDRELAVTLGRRPTTVRFRRSDLPTATYVTVAFGDTPDDGLSRETTNRLQLDGLKSGRIYSYPNANTEPRQYESIGDFAKAVPTNCAGLG